MDPRVRNAVGARAEAGRVRDDRGTRRRVRAAVQNDGRAYEDELTALRRAVRVPELRRMPMDVAVEGFLSTVGHPDRSLGRKREKARVDLERHVLARSERAANPREHQTHL